MMDFRKKLWLIKRRLVPPEEVAGIEITEASLRLLLLDPITLNIETAAEVGLPAGTISAGQVKSLANLAAALRDLKAAAGPVFAHHPSAVLALPPSLFFTQVLSLPDIPEENFAEAARLNAIQVSPIKISEAYFDWQNLGANLETLERELFIAVADRGAIDSYLEAARRAGIDVVAVEPWSLGLTRTFMYFASAHDKRVAFLINRISSDGVDFVVVKDGKSFFSHFFFWQDTPEARGGQISADAFRAIARRGIAKVSSFFTTRHKDPLASAVIFTPFFQDELAAVLRDEFGMKVAGYRFPVLKGETLGETWAGALGAALRGIIPRGDDTIVSLMPIGTEELFRRKQISVYAAFWGKVFAAGLMLFTIVFALVFVFAENFRQGFVENLEVKRRSEGGALAEDLTRRATEFNELVSRVRQAETRERFFIEESRSVIVSAARDIDIRQFSIFGDARQLRLIAFAADRGKAAEFRARLEATGKFREIDLPLALVRSVPGGVEFTVTAVIE